jgi:hypothetical protein
MKKHYIVNAYILTDSKGEWWEWVHTGGSERKTKEFSSAKAAQKYAETQDFVRKIAEKRRKDARYKAAEALLRRIRLRIFDYEDAGKLEKAQRIMTRCQAILAPLWAAQRKAAEDRKLQLTPSAIE